MMTSYPYREVTLVEFQNILLDELHDSFDHVGGKPTSPPETMWTTEDYRFRQSWKFCPSYAEDFELTLRVARKEGPRSMTYRTGCMQLHTWDELIRYREVYGSNPILEAMIEFRATLESSSYVIKNFPFHAQFGTKSPWAENFLTYAATQDFFAYELEKDVFRITTKGPLAKFPSLNFVGQHGARWWEKPPYLEVREGTRPIVRQEGLTLAPLPLRTAKSRKDWDLLMEEFEKLQVLGNDLCRIV